MRSPARPVRALGLMSGTSADGVSLALVELQDSRLRVSAEATYPYPNALRRRILSAPGCRAPELARLSFDLGRAFAVAARRFLRARGVAPRSLSAVGSHGQTVVHLPGGKAPATLQIGEPSFLAEALGVPVVSDFRPRDMAAGGEGAPLVPFLDRFLFGDGPPRALQNIGGIANVALAGRGAPAVAFDTGPGNVLIDLAVRRMSRSRLDFDRDGRIAARGRADEDLARRLASAPYFSRRPPKSLDRSAFGEAYLERHLAPGRTPGEDVVATVTYLTALTIAESYRRFLMPRARLQEAVVSGGGALNPTLMAWLRRLLAPLPVRSIAGLGIPPLAKEPAAMALMAVLAVRGRVNHCPEATGAAGARVLGKVTPAGRG